MALSIYTPLTLNSVFIYMHYFVCPYCAPDRQTHLSEEVVKVENCEHKKGLFRPNKKCREEEYKCKIRKILKCGACKSEFMPSKKFLQGQKRKIKDG
jgi:hypothetical protein